MLKNLAIVGASLVVALSVADWIVAALPASDSARAAAAEGIPFDSRDRIEVVSELRTRSDDWFPTVPPNTFLHNYLTVDGIDVVPLSGVANANAVGCNELGFDNSFTSDRYGFNNPDKAWDGARGKLVMVARRAIGHRGDRPSGQVSRDPGSRQSRV